MYELWHLGFAYVIGTAAGIGIFRTWIQERIITATIDTLIRDEYVRSFEDEDGVTHLYKWHELDDIIRELKNQQQKLWEDESEEDDTP